MLLAPLAAVALAFFAQAQAGTAPALPRPDARANISVALETAKSANRRVLLFWTAKWSGKAAKLDSLFGNRAALRDELAFEYDVVDVNVGTKQLELGAELARSYGVQLSIESVPWLTLLDADGAVLANQDPAAFKDPESHQYDAARVLAFLKRHEAPRRAAAELFAAAKSQAAREDKLVLVTCASRCGSASFLGSWLEAREVRSILTKDFVYCYVDIARTIEGLELARQIASKPDGDCSLPWSGFVSPAGAVVWRLTAREPWELAGLPDAIGRVARRISREELETLRRSVIARAAGGNCSMPGVPVPRGAER